jgi:hypothetical protein
MSIESTLPLPGRYLAVAAYEQHKYMHISDRNSSSTPGVFYKYFYNHAHRLRLEQLL